MQTSADSNRGTEMHLLPFHIWIRTSCFLAKCVIEEGKTEVSHTKPMHRL